MTVSGLLWQELKQVYSGGARAHFIDIYNHIDFFMLKFYMASLTLRQVVRLLVSLQIYNTNPVHTICHYVKHVSEACNYPNRWLGYW